MALTSTTEKPAFSSLSAATDPSCSKKCMCELWCFGRDTGRARSVIWWLISASSLKCLQSEGYFAQNWAEAQRPSQKAFGAAPEAADATFHLSGWEHWGESPDLHFLCPVTSSLAVCIPPSGQFISHSCLHWWILPSSVLRCGWCSLCCPQNSCEERRWQFVMVHLWVLLSGERYVSVWWAGIKQLVWDQKAL